MPTVMPTPPLSPRQARGRRLLQAARAARARIDLPDPSGWIDSALWAAVGECLQWVGALDDLLRRGDTGYAVRRDGHSDGFLLPGMRYLRDRVLHGEDIVDITHYRPGAELGRLTLGVSALGTVSSLLWAGSLPAPPKRYLKPAERDSYANSLAGKDVAHTLDRALSFLLTERA